MTIHQIDVETFYSWWQKGKRQGLSNVIEIHLLGTINVCTKYLTYCLNTLKVQCLGFRGIYCPFNTIFKMLFSSGYNLLKRRIAVFLLPQNEPFICTLPQSLPCCSSTVEQKKLKKALGRAFCVQQPPQEGEGRGIWLVAQLNATNPYTLALGTTNNG